MSNGLNDKKILVVGGCGGMGFEFAKLLRGKKAAVSVFDIAIPKEDKRVKELTGALGEENIFIGDSPEHCNELKVQLPFIQSGESSYLIISPSDYDIIILSVPIEAFSSVVPAFAPKMKEGSLLIDIASIKKEPVEIMLRHAPQNVSVLGTHPLFGPGIVKSMKGWNVALVRPDWRCSEKWFSIIKDLFEAEGAFITLGDADTHDKMVGVSQVITHFVYLSMAKTIQSLNVKLSDLHKYSTPPFEMLMAFTGRLLNANPLRTYATIQKQFNGSSNRQTFLHNAAELLNVIESCDTKQITELINELSNSFGEKYKHWAQAASNKALQPIGEFAGNIGVSKGKIKVFRKRNGIVKTVYGLVLHVERDSVELFKLTKDEFYKRSLDTKALTLRWDLETLKEDRVLVDETRIAQLLEEKTSEKRKIRLKYKTYELIDQAALIKESQGKEIGAFNIQIFTNSHVTASGLEELLRQIKGIQNVTISDVYTLSNSNIKVTYKIETIGVSKEKLQEFRQNIISILEKINYEIPYEIKHKTCFNWSPS